MGLRKLINIFKSKKITSEEFVNKLRNEGFTIGKNCRFFDPESCVVDRQNPHMVTIGDNAKITHGVVFLTHDYSTSVIANVYGDFYGGVGYIHIGNNVFIGLNTIILKNTDIGDNVIIGAGSVVSGILESGWVYAGNPVRKIMSLDDYKTKLEKRQIKDIVEIKQHLKKQNKEYDYSYFKEYGFSLLERDGVIPQDFLNRIERTGERELIIDRFYKTSKLVDIE